MSVIFGQTEYEALYTNHTRAWFANAPGFGYYGTTLLGMYEKQLLGPGQDYFFIGAGFGRWMEYAIDGLGFSADNVAGTELSAYVHSLIDDPNYVNQTHKDLIHNLDITSPTILNDLKAIFGGNGKISGAVISTLVLSCLQTEQEISDFQAACANIKAANGIILHIFVSDQWDGTGNDPYATGRAYGMNYQPRQYWVDRLGQDCWLLDCHEGLTLWRPQIGAWVSLSEVTP